MAITFTPLASGSKGNSLLVTNENHKILIDCGLSMRELVARLAQAGTAMEEIEGIFITHEHCDHVRSVKAISRRYGTPIFGRYETLEIVLEDSYFENCRPFLEKQYVTIGDIAVYPFETPHDAVAPVGYVIVDENSKAVYATDIGHVSTDIIQKASGANLVMIESNYDVNMLENGSYPFWLKERISSDIGHLSNDECAEAVIKMLKNGTQNFVLGHLSEENNTRAAVSSSILTSLEKAGIKNNKDCCITIAYQRQVSMTRCSLANSI